MEKRQYPYPALFHVFTKLANTIYINNFDNKNTIISW